MERIMKGETGRDAEATSSETLADLEEDAVADENDGDDEEKFPSPDGAYDDEEVIEK